MKAALVGSTLVALALVAPLAAAEPAATAAAAARPAPTTPAPASRGFTVHLLHGRELHFQTTKTTGDDGTTTRTRTLELTPKADGSGRTFLATSTQTKNAQGTGTASRSVAYERLTPRVSSVGTWASTRNMTDGHVTSRATTLGGSTKVTMRDGDTRERTFGRTTSGAVSGDTTVGSRAMQYDSTRTDAQSGDKKVVHVDSSAGSSATAGGASAESRARTWTSIGTDGRTGDAKVRGWSGKGSTSDGPAGFSTHSEQRSGFGTVDGATGEKRSTGYVWTRDKEPGERAQQHLDYRLNEKGAPALTK